MKKKTETKTKNKLKKKKQVEALKVLKANTQKITVKDATPENTLTEEAKHEVNNIKEIEKTVGREYLVHRTNKYPYCFKNILTKNTFGRDIYNSKTTLKEADKDQSSLFVWIMYFKKKTKPQNPEKNQEKKTFLKAHMHFLRV